jgi:hypothetical protein
LVTPVKGIVVTAASIALESVELTPTTSRFTGNLTVWPGLPKVVAAISIVSRAPAGGEVGATVGVAPPGVLVADAGVLVGPPGVLVADAGVFVAPPGVLVADAGVFVALTGVLVAAAAVFVGPLTVAVASPPVGVAVCACACTATISATAAVSAVFINELVFICSPPLSK